MMAMSSFGSRTRREKELSQLRPWVGHGERQAPKLSRWCWSSGFSYSVIFGKCEFHCFILGWVGSNSILGLKSRAYFINRFGLMSGTYG